jgi:DNA-binding MarR family transcriptional regulator
MKEILRNLLVTAKEVRSQLEAELAQAGGSLSTWLILNTLNLSDGLTQTQLAECIHVECPTLTRHLDRLEASNLIERRSDPSDRRLTRIYISAAGRQLHQTLLAVVQRFETKLVQNLTESQLNCLARSLEVARSNIQTSHSAFHSL